MKLLAQNAGIQMTKPRNCSKQTMRSNIPATKAPTYFRRTIFIPFLDGMLNQLRDRFQGMSALAIQGLILIPSNFQKLDETMKDKLVEFYDLIIDEFARREPRRMLLENPLADMSQ